MKVAIRYDIETSEFSYTRHVAEVSVGSEEAIVDVTADTWWRWNRMRDSWYALQDELRHLADGDGL